jgi:hypothetical protein
MQYARKRRFSFAARENVQRGPAEMLLAVDVGAEFDENAQRLQVAPTRSIVKRGRAIDVDGIDLDAGVIDECANQRVGAAAIVAANHTMTERAVDIIAERTHVDVASQQAHEHWDAARPSDQIDQFAMREVLERRTGVQQENRHSVVVLARDSAQQRLRGGGGSKCDIGAALNQQSKRIELVAPNRSKTCSQVGGGAGVDVGAGVEQQRHGGESAAFGGEEQGRRRADETATASV